MELLSKQRSLGIEPRKLFWRNKCLSDLQTNETLAQMRLLKEKIRNQKKRELSIKP